MRSEELAAVVARRKGHYKDHEGLTDVMGLLEQSLQIITKVNLDLSERLDRQEKRLIQLEGRQSVGHHVDARGPLHE